jgi:ribosome-associated protein
MKLAGSRLTQDGVLVIRAERHRTQERNRADARARLQELVAQAAIEPRKRFRTRPTRASKERRLEAKARRGSVKRHRRARPDME